MQINGKEYGLMLTTNAAIKLSKLCPKEDLKQVNAVFGKTYADHISALVKVIPILSGGFAEHEKHCGRDAETLTEAEVGTLSFYAVASVMDEIRAVLRRDIAGEVQATKAKGVKLKKDETEAEA